MLENIRNNPGRIKLKLMFLPIRVYFVSTFQQKITSPFLDEYLLFLIALFFLRKIANKVRKGRRKKIDIKFSPVVFHLNIFLSFPRPITPTDIENKYLY